MKSRRLIYAVVLVLGLILIGAGVWLVLNQDSNRVSEKIKPAGSPIITMKVTNRNASSHQYTYVYEDKTVLSLDIGDTRADLGRQGFRIWKYGQIQPEEFNGLIQLFRDNISELEENYQYSGYSVSDGQTMLGDMDTTLSINYDGMVKEIFAKDYLSLYSSYYPGTYAGMPSPLDEICKMLWHISTETAEFNRENIS